MHDTAPVPLLYVPGLHAVHTRAPGFNENDPPPGLPASPLPVAADAVGFRWL